MLFNCLFISQYNFRRQSVPVRSYQVFAIYEKILADYIVFLIDATKSIFMYPLHVSSYLVKNNIFMLVHPYLNGYSRCSSTLKVNIIDYFILSTKITTLTLYYKSFLKFDFLNLYSTHKIFLHLHPLILFIKKVKNINDFLQTQRFELF